MPNKSKKLLISVLTIGTTSYIFIFKMIPDQSLSISVNGSVDLFTGILYMVRIFSLRQGVIQPSGGISSNTGESEDFLEQDILAQGNPLIDALWYLKESSKPGFYQWGTNMESDSLVTWTANQDSIGISNVLELKNINESNPEMAEHFLWSLETNDLDEFGYTGKAFKIRPFSIPTGTVTYSSGRKSPNGYWLKVDTEQLYDNIAAPRCMLDSLFVFEPTNFKLYAEIAHLDIGEPKELLKLRQSKQYLTSTRYLINSSPNITEEKVTVGSQVEYELYAEANPEFNLFSGMTIISPNTVPSRKYFDLEENNPSQWSEGVMTLKATGYITSTEEFEVEPFSTKKISSYVTYLKEFKGVPYISWAHVSAVADMMGDNGQIVRDVLVTDLNLLKHLLRSRGYVGEFKDVNIPITSCGGKQIDPASGESCTTVRIKTRGSIRGSLPIPAVQFEEESTYVPKYQQAYKMSQMGHLS